MRAFSLKTVLALAVMLPMPTLAEGELDASSELASQVIADVVENHILPRAETLAQAGAALETAAGASCEPADEGLRAAFNAAFDGWISFSHLEFGPADEENRADTLAFWPDPRGLGSKSLRATILGADPAVDDPAAFAQASVAVRGFFALELMLYDPAFADVGEAAYRCRLIRAQSADIAALTGAIRDGWTSGGYAKLMETAGANDRYRTVEEAVQELYTALYLGLEFTANNRIALPMGTFDKPNPKKAEAWRSGRSQRNIELSLASLRDLADRLADAVPDEPDLGEQIDYAFGRAIEAAQELDDPALAGVAEPDARFRVESLLTMLLAIRDAIRGELGPELGVAEGFNAGDGD